MLTQLRPKRQITLPKEITDRLGLKSGDHLEIEITDSKIILKPVVILPKDQAWFYSKEWQAGEREADEDIKAGRVKKYIAAEAFLEDLDGDN